MSQIVVTALYEFVSLDNVSEIKQVLLQFSQYEDLKGTLIIAKEGINGTIAASQATMSAVLQWFKEHPVFNIAYKQSFCDDNPFLRYKVKEKKEIVTIGDQTVDPNSVVGKYVTPQQWNQLLQDPNVIVIDTRNDYECQIGQFKGAVNPKTDTFKAFPEYVEKHLDANKHKKVAMYCTGGIRCEKASSLMLARGFEEVYHLEGGILKYLEEIEKKESLWEGDCFVFDQRVAVNHDLEPSGHQQCFACRTPLTIAQMQDASYQAGVSCIHCIDKTTSAQKASFTERQKQHQLAKKRGQKHIGGT
ncbi:MAG: rhodanese-related sulfurtransferase [Pseudomonadota bacterium]|nr:rhodanese-related sulfurtransferase [Pseudomonadota bacterium]